MENAQGVVGFVAPGNRIKWLGFTKEPRKDEHATQSDKPELRIDPGEPFAEPELTTGTNILRVNWRILIATDAQQLDRFGNNMQGASILAVAMGDLPGVDRLATADQGADVAGGTFVHKVKMGVPILTLGKQGIESRHGRLVRRLGIRDLAELQRDSEHAHSRKLKR